MTTDIGITTKKENPFINPIWIKQCYPFTLTRQQQFVKLINKESTDVYSQKPINENKYVAFVAIRWGFAKLLDNRLVTTEKWENRGSYNGYGLIKNLDKSTKTPKT